MRRLLRRTRSTGRDRAAKAPLVLWAASAICSALLAVLLASRASFYLQQPASSPEAEEGRHHHRRRACDDHARWVAKMASLHNATLVLTVDRKGCANFTSLQKAMDAVPDYAAARTLIAVDAGVYAEKVVVWSNKTGVTLQGRGNLNTTIVWNDTANSSGGTFYSATVAVLAANFVAYNVSVQNTAPPADPGGAGGQAVALRVAGDQAAFYWCGFYSSQDTLLDEQGRHFFQGCYVEGSIDFIFGNARSLYHGCTISSVANAAADGTVTGSVTAHGRASPADRTGFAFVGCTVVGMERLERLERPRQAAVGVLRGVRLLGPRRQRWPRAEGGVREAAGPAPGRAIHGRLLHRRQPVGSAPSASAHADAWRRRRGHHHICRI